MRAEHDSTIRNNAAQSRYEFEEGGQVAVSEYERDGSQFTITHTEVPQALRGRNLAEALTRVALDDARAQHLSVIPACPYAASYIRRHPQYADLVPPEGRHFLQEH